MATHRIQALAPMTDHEHQPWYETYFGRDYLLIDIQPSTSREVVFIRKALGLNRDTLTLDAGCGYGRHLLPLVKRGFRVVGADLSDNMLGETRARLRRAGCMGHGLVRGDIRSLPFGRVFDSTINMFNSFGYFAEEHENFQALQSIAGVLKPGGLLLLDLVNRDFLVRSMAPKDWFRKSGAVILEQKRLDVINSRSEIDVTVIDNHGKRTYHHSIRVYSFTEIAMLLEAAGFRVLKVYGGFGFEEFSPNRDRMLILAEASGTEVT